MATELVDVLRAHDDGRAVSGHVDEMMMPTGLRRDVDFLSRFVEEEDAWPESRPLREQHLLLVAAAERCDGTIDLCAAGRTFI